ncbi:MAG: hypothetical protein ACFFE4_23190, partial [Candidatus Thorarchaeota archaeon]
LVSPLKVIERMRKLIRREFQNHLTILEKEVELIDEKYENVAVDIPYEREIRIYFPNLVLEFTINFEKYPLQPSFSFSTRLSKILPEREFNDQDFIKNWDVRNPPHIYQVIEYLSMIIAYRLEVDLLKENSQHLVLEDISINKNVDSVSFKVHRGKSLGIIYKQEIEHQTNQFNDILNFYNKIAGNISEFQGKIDVFGKPVQSLSTFEKEQIFIFPETLDSQILNKKVKNAIEQTIGKQETKNSKIQSIKSYSREVFESLGLLNKMNLRISELSGLDRLLFSIGRSLLQSPIILMILFRVSDLAKTDLERFSQYINKIKQKYHLVILINGPEWIISDCDQILTVTKSESLIGTYEEFLDRLPQAGEIITVETENPIIDLKEKLSKFEHSAVIIEERRNERCKIFLKGNPNDFIIQLTKMLGTSLFSFKRTKATIGEYLEFIKIKE